ncbi:hypothetical protein FA13DRAFT_1018783 [Coprinellus micaceus]|uniref:Uncharacterized protein n=1 Tax=Coprinellus micaceus TaxID=71717 RepID=A0A4Y7SXF8_COPMI|nr:hypothetical protein FA13DRAFT_1018783 [Coprinellus micaceus]
MNCLLSISTVLVPATMAAPAPQPVPQKHSSPGSHAGPGEAAIQRGADEILTLIEREKQNAVQHRDAEINHLRNQIHSMHKEIETLKFQKYSAQQDRERQTKNDDSQHPPNNPIPYDLQPPFDELLKERDSLRESLAAAGTAVEQMGMYSAGPGLYSFSAQWADLFNELGIAGGVPWRPDQLLAVVAATAERLRLHRGDAPKQVQALSPNLNDPFVIEVELNRARRYVTRLEEKQAEIQARPQQAVVPRQVVPPNPPVLI